MTISNLISALFCISVLSVACTSPAKEPVEQKPAPERSVVAPPTVPNNTLNDSQLADIKQIHERFSEVYPISLDETIENFINNPATSKEIEVWKKMVESFQVFRSSFQV